MKEIGGYFGLEQLNKNSGEYYSDVIALNTARNSLIYLAKARKIKKVYLPYYLCESVAGACRREGIAFDFYHTDECFKPIFDKVLEDGEYLYVVNIYGQISNADAKALAEKHGRIILDNTHGFFQKPVEGIDTIYCCRKFFGVPDGAYLSTECRLEEELPTDNSADRTGHIYGRIKDGASAHYAEFKANDEKFIELPLMKMSELTHEMLSVIDYDRAKQIREENFAFLHSKLGGKNKLELRVPEGPYAYPMYCENGMELKKKLAARKIYVATLWPNVLEMDDCLEKDYAENILPLPCDQRYNTEDMETVISELLACL